MEILTLNRNYEGIVRATELEQSSKETLDYMHGTSDVDPSS